MMMGNDHDQEKKIRKSNINNSMLRVKRKIMKRIKERKVKMNIYLRKI